MISRVSTGFEVMDKDLGTRAEIHAVIEERIEERSRGRKRKNMKRRFSRTYTPQIKI